MDIQSLVRIRVNESWDSRTFIHRIDSKDVIIFVNDDWLSFARENSAYSLSQDRVLNKSLWNFIADQETQHLYEIILEKVRATRANIKIPFRCDSPDYRRFMELDILSLPEDFVEFRSRILKLEFRPSAKLLDTSTQRSNEFMKICGWCKKIYVPELEWLEVEEAVKHLRLFEATKLPQLTHGICPFCRETISQGLV